MWRCFTGLTALSVVFAAHVSGQSPPPPAKSVSASPAPGPAGGIVVMPYVAEKFPERPPYNYVPPLPVASQPASGAWYACEESVYTWPDVWEGDDVTHGFMIKNTTKDQTLEIRDARPDCHCTVSGNFDRMIPPGGQGVVPFTFHSRGMASFNLKGATITTNDPRQPMLRVTLQGRVKTVLTMTPSAGASFGEIIDPSTEIVHDLELTSNVEEPIRLEQIPVNNFRPGAQPFDVKVEEKEPGKKWKIALRTVPPMPVGNFYNTFQFKTGHPRLPVWTLSASAYRPERISCKPVQLLYPDNYSGSPPLAVEIFNYGKNPVRIFSAAFSDDTQLKAELADLANHPRVNVSGPPNYSLPSLRHLVLKTDDSEIREVTVNVYTPHPTPALPPLETVNKPASPATVAGSQPSAGGAGATGGKSGPVGAVPTKAKPIIIPPSPY